MKAKRGLTFSLFVLFGIALAGPAETSRFPDPKTAGLPNVLIVVLDAARADHIGFFGYPRPTTPEIDQICRQSEVFTAALAVAPYTVASTASLFTGLYPDVHQVLGLGNRLSREAPTMAESFRKAGYRTLLTGNNPFLEPAFGLDRGFDSCLNNVDYGTDRASAVTEQFAQQLNETAEPFFGYIHYLRPHEPYDAPEDVRAIFGRSGKSWAHDLVAIDQGTIKLTPEFRSEIEADYDAGLRTVDLEVGKVIRLLRTKGVLDRTIVVILADHGEAFGEHGKMSHNSTVYDEMLRVPLIFHYPARLKPKRSDRLAQTVDVFPTLAELAHVSLPEFVQGQSLFGKPRPYAFGQTGETYCVRDADTKMIRDLRGEDVEFFDLHKDPLEKKGIARNRVSGKNAARLAALESVFTRWFGYCLAHSKGNRNPANLNPELVARLKSLGYLR
ncbi:MAG TPA: sulfatase [Acidobacteriota bacterium]|jgi:arylsulfatase A-like enzyme